LARVKFGNGLTASPDAFNTIAAHIRQPGTLRTHNPSCRRRQEMTGGRRKVTANEKT
jgi:hypothetical protein